uniref:WAP domain-containing protein n=1 Tax=Sinocyclocheilus grahami TaxID=75366 RepID=A0A672MD60_SINGR
CIEKLNLLLLLFISLRDETKRIKLNKKKRRTKISPGECPPQSSGIKSCTTSCNCDSNCPNNEKCCSNGCGRYCTVPYEGIYVVVRRK